MQATYVMRSWWPAMSNVLPEWNLHLVVINRLIIGETSHGRQRSTQHGRCGHHHNTYGGVIPRVYGRVATLPRKVFYLYETSTAANPQPDWITKWPVCPSHYYTYAYWLVADYLVIREIATTRLTFLVCQLTFKESLSSAAHSDWPRAGADVEEWIYGTRGCGDPAKIPQ